MTVAPEHHFDERGSTEHYAPFDRRSLTVEAWRNKKLPPRDYLLEGVMCTTSRWLVNGETGVGKTLFGLELGLAIAGGADFLAWNGVRKSRVMYLDGEMPAETLKERIEAAATIYGNVDLIAYNRDVMGPAEMPALNTAAGQAWLWKEIEAFKPDLIVFDSIMCLLVGPLSEEETWAPMTPLVRQISSRRIAQVWLHHTGHDTSKGFGSKTKEWEMDTVVMLAKKEGVEDDGSVLLDFRKARLRTPKAAGLFKPQVIHRDEDGWTTQPGTTASKESTRQRKRKWFREVYNELAVDVVPVPGHTAMPVRKVSIENIRLTMIKRGFLALEDGNVPTGERTLFRRAREDLIRDGVLATDGDNVWSLK